MNTHFTLFFETCKLCTLSQGSKLINLPTLLQNVFRLLKNVLAIFGNIFEFQRIQTFFSSNSSQFARIPAECYKPIRWIDFSESRSPDSPPSTLRKIEMLSASPAKKGRWRACRRMPESRASTSASPWLQREERQPREFRGGLLELDRSSQQTERWFLNEKIPSLFRQWRILMQFRIGSID